MTEGATPMPQPRYGSTLDLVIAEARAEERRLVVREIRERFKDDAPTAATSTLAIRRILDEVEATR